MLPRPATFGFGLSYATFEYSNLRSSAEPVSVDVKNRGTRASDQVVQLYVARVDSAGERPIKELLGFERIALRPNQTRTVRLPWKGACLTYWDAGKQSFVVEPGSVRTMLGGSSAGVRLEQTTEVKK